MRVESLVLALRGSVLGLGFFFVSLASSRVSLTPPLNIIQSLFFPRIQAERTDSEFLKTFKGAYLFVLIDNLRSLQT